MDPEHISDRIKTLRISAGMSQNQLAERAGISLRTVQRVENGETIPRGDTLRRIALALQVDLATILEAGGNLNDSVRQGRQLQPDMGYLHLMNISMLGILINPLLWILLPLIFWLVKKEKSRIVDETGIKILEFQITMIVLFLSIPLLATWFWDSAVAYHIMSNTIITPRFLYGMMPNLGRLVTLLLVWNFFMIAWNAWRIQHKQGVNYFPAIPFHYYLSKMRIRIPANQP